MMVLICYTFGQRRTWTQSTDKVSFLSHVLLSLWSSKLTCYEEIRSAILEGDIDKALKHTNAYYPSVLRDNENIYFKLRCRKFIEMIRRTNELSKQLNSAPNPTSRRSTDSRAHNDEYDFEMELDEQLGLRPGDDKMDTEDGVHAEDAQVRYQKLTQETIEYGMVLKQEFANDPRREVKRALEDTFALIAYENEVESSLAPLLDKAGRVPVAEELNSAILGEFAASSLNISAFIRAVTC
jgi:hypothetical protein